MALTVGSLFSGIGGIDLGLERAGMKVLWQVEIDAWCRAVLAKHWPDVAKFGDIREVGARNLPRVDLIAGGFPCQDLSYAGKGVGLSGARSGLWFEYARLIRELRPRYVLVENVPGLLARGIDVVLGDLAACGYDAEWDSIPAAAVGAPHRRDRVWLVAYPNGRGRVHGQAQEQPAEGRFDALGEPLPGRPALADADRSGRGWAQPADEVVRPAVQGGRPSRDDARASGSARGEGVADAAGDGWLTWGPRDATEESGGREPDRSSLVTDELADAPRDLRRALGDDGPEASDGRGARGYGWWSVEPSLGRVAHGVPNRVDRLRGLGNAVVPQVVEWIGRRIVEAEAVRSEQ